MPHASDLTIQYYNDNAEEFIEGTLHVDMSEVYKPFLELIPKGGKILDAGCGSGRDSLYFMQQGYEVEAFDASAKMAEAASRLIGKPVRCCTFDEIVWESEFSGVWACASLLHVERVKLKSALESLSRATKSGGVIYTSFKYGDGSVLRNGRHFTNFTEGSLVCLLAEINSLSLHHTFVTDDARPDRGDEKWLNVLMEKR